MVGLIELGLAREIDRQTQDCAGELGSDSSIEGLEPHNGRLAESDMADLLGRNLGLDNNQARSA